MISPNGYIKVTNIPSFIEQIELKLSSKETLREVTKVEFEAYCLDKYGKSFFGKDRSLVLCKEICRRNFDSKYLDYLDAIIPLDKDIKSLVKLLAVAVNADLKKNELYVSFKDYFNVIE